MRVDQCVCVCLCVCVCVCVCVCSQSGGGARLQLCDQDIAMKVVMKNDADSVDAILL